MLRKENQNFKNQLDSRTSHFSSSKTIIKPIKSLREPSGKKPRGQIEREGTPIEPSSNPDNIIDHKPDTCDYCGNKLKEEWMEICTSRQVFATFLLYHASNVRNTEFIEASVVVVKSP